MAAPANVAALEKPEGKAGERGDAVIALLAGDRDMVEAERAELKLRKLALDATIGRTDVLTIRARRDTACSWTGVQSQDRRWRQRRR